MFLVLVKETIQKFDLVLLKNWNRRRRYSINYKLESSCYCNAKQLNAVVMWSGFYMNVACTEYSRIWFSTWVSIIPLQQFNKAVWPASSLWPEALLSETLGWILMSHSETNTIKPDWSFLSVLSHHCIRINETWVTHKGKKQVDMRDFWRVFLSARSKVYFKFRKIDPVLLLYIFSKTDILCCHRTNCSFYFFYSIRFSELILSNKTFV